MTAIVKAYAAYAGIGAALSMLINIFNFVLAQMMISITMSTFTNGMSNFAGVAISYAIQLVSLALMAIIAKTFFVALRFSRPWPLALLATGIFSVLQFTTAWFGFFDASFTMNILSSTLIQVLTGAIAAVTAKFILNKLRRDKPVYIIAILCLLASFIIPSILWALFSPTY